MPKRADLGEYALNEITPYSQPNSEVKETFKFTGELALEFFKQQPETSLDVGCANGALTQHLVGLFPKTLFTGIDTTPQFIEVANNLRLKNSKFIAQDLEKYSQGSIEKFDLVTCIGTLSMFENPSATVKQLIGLTKFKGGLLIIETNFNYSDFDVRIEYRKSTKDIANEYSYGLDSMSVGLVSSELDALGVKYHFRRMPFYKEIPRVPESLIPRWYTINHPINEGEKLLINDLGMYMQHSFLVIAP
jgi:SAM-dependent methyltransferase